MGKMIGASTRGGPDRKQVGMLVGAILIAVGGASAWLLSILHIVAGIWAGVAGVFFTVLGVLLAFLQWQWPRIAAVGTSSPPPSSSSPDVAVQPGGLRVMVRAQLCGSTIYLSEGFSHSPRQTKLAAGIIERRNGNQQEYIAEFFEVVPGNYTVWINSHEPLAHVTIPAGQVMLIDWRTIQP